MVVLPLRRLSESLIPIRSVMFGAIFNLHGYTCRTTVMFGTLKDSSLEIKSLALNNCFSYKNVSQNGVKSLISKSFHRIG